MSTPPVSIEKGADLTDAASAAGIERLRALADDLTRAYAPNTQRAWRADWRTWVAFCVQTGAPTWPATVEGLRAFLEDAIARGRKRATLNRYLSTLSSMHRLADLPWPLDSQAGRLMWQGVRRQVDERQTQATGLTIDRLDAVIDSLDVRELRAARDAALLATAYDTMARASELVRLEIPDVSGEPDDSARVLIRRSKTDQEGKGALLYLSPASWQRVQHWIAVAGLTEGPLFRAVPRAKVPKAAGALTERDVSRIFKARVGAAGLDVDKISAHSTRVGPAQDLLAEGYGLPEIQQQGRWKNPQMVVRYGERIQSGRSAMARFRGSPRPKRSGA
ncbi:site-specific integrase (plasmid) [Flagellatimonas centrodinii]|uniref:tyrosine-type recombinase/integrase n=1 Tax=Flagellatimonas centrodinii TaxID=2806210 RepID=UPI001FFB2DB5|nr:tyrosine-type recombinase/integrase [Flagellatimonas centrodinii]ULQ48314.1 site-specific integrase [Flagellatimonas centrodinii]